MIHDDVLSAIGNTPVIRLRRIPEPGGAQIVVKFEGLNVGGSIKTRSAAAMVADAQRAGRIGPDTVLCEVTSGNQGVGIALVGAVLGIRVRIVMPDCVSVERRLLMEAYGAEVVLVHDAGDIGAAIDECMRLADAYAAADPNVLLTKQFENPANPGVHHDATGAELIDQVGTRIDGFCAGIGTGGTISGIGRALREVNPDVEIWAVEPQGAAILTGGTIGTHLQMGIGDGLIPANLDQTVYSQVAVISDDEALAMARRLAREEGLLAGISSGSNVVAAVRLAAKLGPGKLVATILPDTGERYFSTPLYVS